MAKIKKVHLLKLGFEPGEALRLALKAMQHEAYARKDRETKLALLQELLHQPESFRKHQLLSPVAAALAPLIPDPQAPTYPDLRPSPLPYRKYGEAGIEAGALDQMEIAARLPVARAAALMPDAHQGYGLPIGGVLATVESIIPYAVGVDIGCRMCLSVFPLQSTFLDKHQNQLKRDLIAHTVFGPGKGPEKPWDDPVLDRTEFKEIPLLRGLKDKAYQQIGSSGGGNHFVEFGEVELADPEPGWNLKPGRYLGLLSHSGSRGLGAQIAHHYTRLAMEKTRLPREARHLAWLELSDESGQEYWHAMNLAGDYASACHDHIHRRLAVALGEKALVRVENHHNFAWRESLPDGTEVMVHRKGATPAGKGVLGIIPGSMTAPGFIVRGKGEPQALSSAAHGAGRRLSRSKARQSLTGHQLREALKASKVSLIGGDLDEAPMAYKDIHEVMAHQRDLVEVVGTFYPRLVRMDQARTRHARK